MRSMQSDEDHKSPSPSQYKLPYSSLPFVRISCKSQHLEAAAPGAELKRECNSTNGRPGRDEELMGQNSRAKGKGKERDVSQSEVLGQFYNPNTTPKDKERVVVCLHSTGQELC